MVGAVSGQVYIVSHEEDVDGIGSAAIALRNTGSRRLYLVGYDLSAWADLGRLLRKGCRSNGSIEILISDLNPGKRHIEILAESLVGCPSKKISWVDHHVWRDEVLSFAERLGYIDLYIDRSRTATENMARFFNVESDPALKPLLELSRDTDYGLFRHPLSEPLTDTIRYSLYAEGDKAFLKRLALKFSKGVFWDYEVDSKWALAIERKRKAIEDIRNNSREVVIGGYKALVIISDPVVGSRIAVRESGRRGYDLAFVVYKNGAVIIARGSENINCAEIAWKLGGGGHPHVAGAQIDPGVVSRGFEAVVEYLRSRI
ncbi:hypothetical protein ATG_09390 [Desulfurococcaceae archaeon AG1]|nr:hypothetical protein ATG_09390 [Desulfurococcaceae archaeon AG1]